MSKVTVSAQHIADLKPLSIVKDELVRQRFIDLYGALWSEDRAEAVYEREAIHFNRLISENQSLRNCTSTSIFVAFIDLAVCGLSVEPGTRALAYLQPRGYKTGAKDERGKDIYEQRCTLTISGYGELIQRTRAGQIRHADNPVIVYEGDGFSFTDKGGVKSVEYTLNLNHDTRKPIACFMRITRADGSIDYAIMLEEDWRRLAGYSGKANKKWDENARTYVETPNALYTSGEGNRIDSGFLMAKCIKHAFKTYPKLRIGRGTTYESDEAPVRDDDFYGIDPNDNPDPQAAEESFAPAPDTSAGVTVDPAENQTVDDVF
ncbi:MAG: recombinase RecT [Muribaculaceae bacterium]|nr:recombinase RecT [Muribaculaceae bacterium]